MPRGRRDVLRGLGAASGLAMLPGLSAAESDASEVGGESVAGESDTGGVDAGSSASAAEHGPPKEAYQPQSSKNWWYGNAHLFADGEPRYDVSFAIIADHGGDAAGHLLLFTLVDYESGETIGTNVEGVVQPSVERYAASFTGHDASGAVRRTGADPFTFDLAVSVAGVDLTLTYETRYDRKMREGYPEGAGTGNVLFWNQARCSGEVSTGDETTQVEGVGFLEHVWGTWSRVPQKGIDFVNGHLGRPGKGDGLPTESSFYFRRTFYHGTPASGPIQDDVGPVLFLTRDGSTWHAARAVTCTFDNAPCEDHRTGTPDVGHIKGEFEDGGKLDVTFDQRTHATVSIPDAEPLGNIHEGAADLSGSVTFPGEAGRQPVEGLAQTEHQRFGPQYPY